MFTKQDRKEFREALDDLDRRVEHQDGGVNLALVAISCIIRNIEEIKERLDKIEDQESEPDTAEE